MAKQYGFGVIGTGMIGEFHAQAIEGLANGRLVAVCDQIEPKVKEFAAKHKCDAYTDFKEMLERDDIDVVTISTPSGAHMEPAVAAAEAGKHAIVEKPVEITLERIDRVLAAHDKAGTTIGGVFNGRFTETAGLLKKAVDQGRFGRMTFAMAYGPWWRDQSYYDEGGWKGTQKFDGGGALMNQGIHTVDLIQWLMGPVVSVQAYADTLAHTNIEVEDTGAAAVRFANGALGTIACTTSMWPGHFRIVEVSGDKGTVALADSKFLFWQFADETEEDEKIRSEHLEFPAVSVGASSASAGVTADGHRANFKEFIEALEAGRQPLVSGPEARKSVEIILAIYRSANQGKAVSLPL
jgi:predicted dehydrogenase